MAAKQFWQKNLWWLLPGWSLFSLIYRPGWSVFGAGLLFWVLLLYFSAPGIFWNYLAHLIPDPEKSKAFFQKALDAGAVIPQPYFPSASFSAGKKNGRKPCRCWKKP